ncbi:MAG TPA: uracil-DNA glycosylase [Candidatus Dormibacteraeota bacterium]|jgi:uracil-DNA glycosylase family 4|nr:uracil-DNA glycosylase [Candidatus Dormibacteraeota bacterium]
MAGDRGGTGGPEAGSLDELEAEITHCRRCPRLVAWREQAARERPSRFADWDYWARPAPGFGDPAARLMIVGLAPAANGANRTGRMFTGDRSGDWLYGALYRAGLANQPTSTHRDDGLRLTDVFIGGVVRCAPPANRPLPEERDNCLPFLMRELALMPRVRVLLCLGSFAWDGLLRGLAGRGLTVRPKPRFSHLAEARVGPYALLGSYHPSQQNTFTGKLTVPMFDRAFFRARELMEEDERG